MNHSRNDLSEDDLPVEVPDEEVNLKDINSGYLIKITESRFRHKVGRGDWIQTTQGSEYKRYFILEDHILKYSHKEGENPKECVFSW